MEFVLCHSLASAISYCSVSFASFIFTLGKGRNMLGTANHFPTERPCWPSFHTNPHFNHTGPKLHLFSFPLAVARMTGSRGAKNGGLCVRNHSDRGEGMGTTGPLWKTRSPMPWPQSPPLLHPFNTPNRAYRNTCFKVGFFCLFYFVAIHFADNSRPTSITGEIKCLPIFLRILNLNISLSYHFFPIHFWN